MSVNRDRPAPVSLGSATIEQASAIHASGLIARVAGLLLGQLLSVVGPAICLLSRQGLVRRPASGSKTSIRPAPEVIPTGSTHASQLMDALLSRVLQGGPAVGLAAGVG